MSANLTKNHQCKQPGTNNLRLLQARGALNAALKPKPRHMVALIRAELGHEDVTLYYLLDGYNPKKCKISLEKLTEHVLENYSSAGSMSDVVAYYYLEENLQEVCLAYVAAGKEVTPC
jgi:hypothetical protein